MADIQPLLTDEPITDPLTGRITIRAQDFFEALRAQTNETADTTDQQAAFLVATIQALSAEVTELNKRLDDVEQLANGC